MSTENDDIADMLRDLLWLNSVIATELIQTTENTSQILRNGNIPDTCRDEHRKLREVAMNIADRYKPGTELRKHLENHQ
ncbi:hypothetical protein J2128_002531 [Methanomicrobium sp. W14]|jgi:hypothetical protein|uniref:hypothetical protein n=1 Tax=Methanomicrobium sp. W14 TaxID=2817839 RepID=UPI001AE4D550|nr:hypothetical protein [Methanomicrobium sp. W14]MBP2134560.1 hypothetical protein [Methanomicrobium sp. W14]